MTRVNIAHKDNIKMGLKAMKFPDVNWIYMVPDVAERIDCVNMVKGIGLLYKEGNITVCEIGGSRSIVTGMRHRVDW
jgi:hypothetical protein